MEEVSCETVPLKVPLSVSDVVFFIVATQHTRFIFKSATIKSRMSLNVHNKHPLRGNKRIQLQNSIDCFRR